MALIHILDKQNDNIIGTLNTGKGQVAEPLLTTSIENMNTFDMTALAHFDKLTKRNRLLVQNVDGFFEEFIITYAVQYKRHEKEVRSSGSFIDLQTAKVIEPQTIGDTPKVMVDFAVSGTEWKVGNVAYTGNLRNIKIEEHTDPYSLLKLIASTFGLEIRFRVVVEGNRITGRYVDMVEEIAGFEGKEIEFGKDLIGIRRIEDSMNIVTALVGLGPIREDGTRLEVYVENQESLERWGRNGRHLVRIYEPESTDENMTIERLTTLTKNELEKRIDAIVSYECEAASLESVFGRSHEKIRLGQTVRIKDDGYTPFLYLEARIRETTENVANQQVVNFKIGNFIEFSKEDLEKQYKTLLRLLAQKIDDARLQSAIEETEIQLTQYVDEHSEKIIPVQPTPPEDPEIDDKWIDTSNPINVLKSFNGEDWEKASPTNASEIGAIEVNKQYTNGLLWSELLGLIVERSDGKLRTVMSGDSGFYIEEKIDSEWVKVFYADATGLKFAGILEGASGSFSGRVDSGEFYTASQTVSGEQFVEGKFVNGDLILERRRIIDTLLRAFLYLQPGYLSLGNEGGTTTINGGSITAYELNVDKIKADPWQSIVFQNGWANYGSPFTNSAYMKDAFGFVHVKLFARNGAQDVVMFTLPASYRPDASMRIVVGIYGGSSTAPDSYGVVQLYSNGQVIGLRTNPGYVYGTFSFKAV